MDTMNELVLDFLQDIYYAEKAGLRAMAKMAKAAEDDELKNAILEHRRQSESQVTRLADAFSALGKRPRGKDCAAMDGLIHEAEEAIEDSDKGPVLDAALIACAQAMDHYEIARYGALAAWMRQMGEGQAADTLQAILDEEKQSDARLNELALRHVNPEANEEEGEGEDEEAPGEGEAEEAEQPEPEASKPRRGGRAKAQAAEPEKPARKAPARKPASRAKK